MVVSFVVGLEGCGHHWFNALWTTLAEIDSHALFVTTDSSSHSEASTRNLSEAVLKLASPPPTSITTDGERTDTLATCLEEFVAGHPAARALGLSTCSFQCGGGRPDAMYGPGRWPKLANYAHAV